MKKNKKAKKKTNNYIAIGAVLALLIGSAVYSQSLRKEETKELIVVDRIKGNPDADIVITKYSDFECPFCAAASPMVDQMLDLYGDKVRFEYKHLPLAQIHANAVPAAEAAEAAGQQGKFFEFHDLLFQRQSDWSRSHNSRGVFLSYAEELELDVPLFKKHMANGAIKDIVRKDVKEATRKNYQSTPTFEFNGERIEFQGYQTFEALIEEALNETE